MQKRYLAVADTWLSHECRLVKAGQEFETEFPPGPKGAPMRLGDNLKEVSKPKGKKADDEKADEPKGKKADDEKADEPLV